ncbi:hypothetical protein H5T53_05335 [Candidatus Bipolaricaulota bacterium]|nr:hypothetical protein [Candidatus Bipolaricaulota bacterium]
MLHKGWGVGLCILWALLGWAQTYGPGEVWYGGVRLQFAGKLATAGTCAPATQPGPGVTQIQCQVPEGAAGTIELTATRTPAGAVNIRAESPPAGWPSSLWVQQMGQWVDSRSSVASGWGAVTAQYRFTPPAGSAGRSYEVRFRAWTAGVIGELELRVILDVVRGITPTPPTPPTYGPFTGTTDGAGRFDVPIPTLPNTAVTGLLTECTVRPLPYTPVSVTLVPKPGTTIRGVGDIGAVRVSSPGYPEAEIVQLTLASSMDMWGRTYTTVDVGTVCLRPTVPPVTPPPGPITGKTDGEGKFTVPLPWPGTTVTGRLTECGQQPLPNQTFTLTLLPKGEVIASPEDIAGFTFSVPGYQKIPVTQFSKFSLFGLTGYLTGDVCLPSPCTLIIRGKVDDGAPHGGPAYPISTSKVWLFVLEEGDTLPLDPLSVLARRPTAETSTNHTNERSFDGTEFRRAEEARYEFRLQWAGRCPPRVVVVSLLWYHERDLMAVSSENPIGGRYVPIYLANLVLPPRSPYAPAYPSSRQWQQTRPNEYSVEVDFSYGRDPLARDSARVIGVAGRVTSEEWDRKGVDPDVFMRGCAHFYFYGYKAMRYIEHLAQQLGVSLQPVAVSMFTTGTTRCHSQNVEFGDLAGGAGRRVNADAQVMIMAGDNDSDASDNEKPDNTIWHELGHYWWLQIYGRFFHGADENHKGYTNPTTTDSLQEGFAEFTSMLIAEHYGDPRPFRYNSQGNNHNLEVDVQVWGPPLEEWAIAGLLWDLHDGGDVERKPVGTISTVVETRDHVTLSDAQVFEIFVERKPISLKDLHDALVAYPAHAVTDTDGDGVPDVRELFVAHGGFEDIAPTNRRWDGGDERIGFGGRAGRPKSPPLPQAYLLIRLVDTAGRAVPPGGAMMHVDMRFADPFTYYNYQDTRPLGSSRVYFVMPPDFYPVTAFITVDVPGVGKSEPLTLTAEQYWNLYERAVEAGLDYLLEHTFVLAP